MTTLNHQTDEALDRMLAVCLGWTKIELYEDNQGPPIWHGFPPPRIGVDSNGDWESRPHGHSKTIPRYTQSLDECARVEAGLTDEQAGRYLQILSCDILPRKGRPHDILPVFATPRNKTLALIATLT